VEEKPFQLMDTAPDFSLVDTHDQEVHLSDFRGKKNVVLVFNRGFA
jgi:peroxiredoxin